MKTKIIPLIGDPKENLYQLGLREREAFLRLEKRVNSLLSTNPLLRFGQDIFSRAKLLLKKKETSFFQECLISYAEGLGIEPVRYFSFLMTFETAAHYGHLFPELKGLLPGCTSVLSLDKGDICHTRLLDFPLHEIFEDSPGLYYWKPENQEGILTYSCAGMAPLFLQGIHGSGVSLAVHHKPAKTFHQEGQSIFEIVFEAMFEGKDLQDLKKEFRRRVSFSKWSIILLEKTGSVLALDIDGPSQDAETYLLHESSPLIFTNIPLQKEKNEFQHYIKLCEDRQNWTREKLSRGKNLHMLDLLTDIKDQKIKDWKHPAATLSTVAAYQVNLSRGLLDVKEGAYALTASDPILRFSLDTSSEPHLLKPQQPETTLEKSWKRVSRAQAMFDQGQYDLAYHELQMARAQIGNSVWERILEFYECVWDFKFISNQKELALVYKRVRKLQVPQTLQDQWTLLIMRLEKKLDLSPTVTYKDVSPENQDLFQQEKLAAKPLFTAWMKLLYPRLEILEVFSPHQK